MFLTIITRTFNQRPFGLQRCVDSVKAHNYGDIQHLVVVDSVGRGLGWSFTNLKNVAPSVLGEYVMLLDDDDYLTCANFVDILSNVTSSNPEVIIVRMDMGDGRVLPGESNWGSEPVLGAIAVSCYIVRRDVWLEHVGDFVDAYDSDFRFIDAVYKHGHQFEWLPVIASRVGNVSHGQPEVGCAFAVGLPPTSA